MIKRIFLIALILCLFLVSAAYPEDITLVAVGDIMLGRYIAKDLARKGYSFPYQKVQGILSSADVTFGNLECSISKRGKTTGKGYFFRASPEAAPGLARAGFDILSLANNHSMDYGALALQDTIEILNKNHILPIGAGKNLTEARKPIIIEVKKRKIAFLAYSFVYPETYWAGKDRAGTSPGKIEFICQDIKRAQRLSDLVIVSFHWGKEYSEVPSDYQIRIAHQAIDAGADLIIGHHPHVLQGIEFYKEKPILYSLGNFIFDQAFGNTRKGIILKCIFSDGNKLKTIIGIPISRTYATYYPQIAQEKEKEEIISHFLGVSKSLNKEQENLSRLRFKE